MPGKIQPNNNQRSATLPVDDEVEAVIVVPYILDSVSGEYVPQSPSSGGGGGIDPVSIKDPVTPANRLTVDSNGRIGINNFPSQVGVNNLPEDRLLDIRVDYGARTDGNFEYTGSAIQGTLASQSGWTIKKASWDGSGNLTRVQTISGIWNDRATLGWT